MAQSSIQGIQEVLAIARPLGDHITDDGIHTLRWTDGGVYKVMDTPIDEGVPNPVYTAVDCTGDGISLTCKGANNYSHRCRFGFVLCPDMGCVVINNTIEMSKTWHTWGRTWVDEYSNGDVRTHMWVAIAMAMVFDPRRVKLETDMKEVVSRKRKEVGGQVACFQGVLPGPALKVIGQALRPQWV